MNILEIALDLAGYSAGQFERTSVKTASPSLSSRDVMMLTGALAALAAIAVHVRSPFGPLSGDLPFLIALCDNGHGFLSSRVRPPLGQEGPQARRFAGAPYARAAGRRSTGRCGCKGVVVQVGGLRFSKLDAPEHRSEEPPGVERSSGKGGSVARRHTVCAPYGAAEEMQT